MRLGITNLKGGVGKTTLSINLAVCFAHMKLKTVIIDTDLNQNSFAWYAAREVEPKVTAMGATDPKGLTKLVDTLSGQYDIVIMDGSPTLSEMNTRVMLASDLLLIPTRPGAHDYRAMEAFIQRVNMIREQRPDLPVYFVLNEYNDSYQLHRTVKDSLTAYEIPLLTNMLKSRTAYGESNFAGIGAFEHPDKKAKGEVYRLAKEVISLTKKTKQ
jgi:chromosome partitioning protein